ncbi:hypothetical protein AB4068_15585, partial [Arthrobacter sp. 2RAF22]|uniref:hypothetical protein n=1 Tax=Arthrobacter sp. 2RAF22 TaxID=3232996 RepID=UPI003F9248AB
GSTTAMIDTDLLVYAGTLAIFIIAALAVGILCLVVFTALATTASIKKARRTQRVQHEYVDVQDPELLDAETCEETPVPDVETTHRHSRTGNRGTRLGRTSRPRLIQHI